MATKNITPASEVVSTTPGNIKPARKTRTRKTAPKATEPAPAVETPAAEEEQKNMNPVILASRAGKFFKVYIFNPETQTESEPWFCATPQKGMPVQEPMYPTTPSTRGFAEKAKAARLNESVLRHIFLQRLCLVTFFRTFAA